MRGGVMAPGRPGEGGACAANRPCPDAEGNLCGCPDCATCGPPGELRIASPGIQPPCGAAPPPAAEAGTTGTSLLSLSGSVTGASPLGMSYTINVLSGSWSPAIPEGARVFHAVLQYGWTPFCSATSWGFQDNYGAGIIPALVWNQEGVHAINGARGGDGLLNVIAVATWACTGPPPHNGQFARVQLNVSWRTVE